MSNKFFNFFSFGNSKFGPMSEQMRKLSNDANTKRSEELDFGPFINKDRVYQLIHKRASAGEKTLAIRGFLRPEVRDFFISEKFEIEEVTEKRDRECPEYTIISW